MVLGIVTVRIVARAVFVTAHARNVKVFGLDLARNGNGLSLERELRFGIHGRQDASRKAGRVHALVLGEVIPEPCHGGAVLAILDDTGTSGRLSVTVKPGVAIDIAPQGNTRNMLVFHEVRNLFLIALLLDVVVGRCNVVFADEHRGLGLVPDFLGNALERIDA